LLESLLNSFAAGSQVNRNCRKFHLTAFAPNFDRIARSQKYKKAHKGSQAAAISKKSVFGNAAMLAACNGRNYLAQLMGVTVAWLWADQDRKLSTKKTVTGESQKNQKPSARESENVAVPKVPRELV
jgi:hypothetical protein